MVRRFSYDRQVKVVPEQNQNVIRYRIKASPKPRPRPQSTMDKIQEQLTDEPLLAAIGLGIITMLTIDVLLNLKNIKKSLDGVVSINGINYMRIP